MEIKRNEPLGLSEAREQLSPLVRRLTEEPGLAVPVSVRGEVRAYLVSASRLEALERTERLVAEAGPRPKIKGTLRVVGDLEAGSCAAATALEAAAGSRNGR